MKISQYLCLTNKILVCQNFDISICYLYMYQYVCEIPKMCYNHQNNTITEKVILSLRTILTYSAVFTFRNYFNIFMFIWKQYLENSASISDLQNSQVPDLQI